MSTADEPTDPTVEGSRSAVRGRTLGRGTSVGRYLLLDLIGEGGMGRVYKAYDPELDRAIALKLLHTEDVSSSHRDRLLREAQALARLSHPNVIAVHDVGTFGGDVFIAMEFVEGQTVRGWLKQETRGWREIVDVFVAAGEGLSAAHRAGLVHRDFKPDNVMRASDGRVRVLDFGLARATPSISSATGTAAPKGRADGAAGDLEPSQGSKSMPANEVGSESGRFTPRLLDTALTRDDMIVGTPRFMAPEQHAEGAVDEAADQFSFCVSLYWSLYGTFPYDGLEASLTGRLADPPEGSTVPRWVRQVLARGLAARSDARHPSMAALLEALRADPQVARRRWLRAGLAGVAVAAVGIAAFAGALAYRARRAVAEQARLGQQFGQEVERIAAMSRYGASLPLHDTRLERDAILARMEALKERMRELGPLAEGPGHEALGRGYLALERYPEALRELEAAQSGGYRSAEISYALGMAHGKLYQRALAALKKTSDPKLDEERRAELARVHRDPALRSLKEARAREGPAQAPVGVDAPEYVEGLIALYEQRFDDALALARRTAERVLWPYDARTLEGDIHQIAGKERYLKGDVEGALAELASAGVAYRAAREVARSGLAAHLGECQRLVETAKIDVDRDRSPEASVNEGLKVCATASTARPDDGAPLVAQAELWHQRAGYQKDHGQSPLKAESEAMSLGERALAIDGADVRAHEIVGFAQAKIGELRTEKGEEARPSFDQAIAHAERLIAIDPGRLEGHSLLLSVYYALGLHEEAVGNDPRRSYQAAIDHGYKAIAISPGDFRLQNRVGTSWASMGAWQMHHGIEPTEAFSHAIESFHEVVRITPKLDYGHANLCSVYSDWAEHEKHHGRDPRPRLEQAIASCREAVRLDDNYAGSRQNLASIYCDLAAWQRDHEIDPTEQLVQARAAITRALEIDPTNQMSLAWAALIELVDARWLMKIGRDPRPAFATGEARVRRELEVSNGTSSEALGILADLHRWRAQWCESRGASVAADVRQGLSFEERALALDPRRASGIANQGALHLIGARAAHGRERVAEAERARAAFERALAIEPALGADYGPLAAEATRLAAP
jgi:serine/threonine-protein kinase